MLESILKELEEEEIITEEEKERIQENFKNGDKEYREENLKKFREVLNGECYLSVHGYDLVYTQGTEPDDEYLWLLDEFFKELDEGGFDYLEEESE
jgi:hypothetical protein